MTKTKNYLHMKNKLFTIMIIAFLTGFFGTVKSQDLDKMLNDATNNNTDYTTATFKSTRIVNGHSIERMPVHQLDFRISHRFGQLNTGGHYLWGLDQAYIHFSLEYGITNWMMVGLGRGTFEKTYDGFVKFSILRQSKGARNMPISLSYFSSSSLNTLYPGEMGLAGKNVPYWSRFSYVNQLLIARKFNERLSLEINPTLVHRNLVPSELDPNDIVAVGGGLRFKLTKRISFNGEYYYVVPPMNDHRSVKTYNPLSIGFDIETGGHVFQLFLSNSEAMIEKGFIADTNSKWSNGGIHFGFNVSRVFGLGKQK
jgi:hypothetical protein